MFQSPQPPKEHDRFSYSPIVDRPPLRWPNGARVAVWVIPNIEHFLFDRPSTSITHATTAARSRCAELFLARLRRARGHLAHDGGHGEARVQRHGRAQFRGLPPLPADR